MKLVCVEISMDQSSSHNELAPKVLGLGFGVCLAMLIRIINNMMVIIH